MGQYVALIEWEDRWHNLHGGPQGGAIDGGARLADAAAIGRDKLAVDDGRSPAYIPFQGSYSQDHLPVVKGAARRDAGAVDRFQREPHVGVPVAGVGGHGAVGSPAFSYWL